MERNAVVALAASVARKLGSRFCLGLFLGLLATGCSSVSRSRVASATPRSPNKASAETGTASYYATKYHGRKTASGEVYNMNRLTAAHRTLPFGTRVKVTNLSNNRSVMVHVNDRGPFARGRIIDVSLAAAKQLEMVGRGTARVRLETDRPPEKQMSQMTGSN